VLGERSKVADLTETKQQLQQQIEAARQAAIVTPTTPTGQPLAGEQALRVTALSSALATRTAWDRILRGITLVMPDGVWLKSLTANSQAGDPTLPESVGVSSVSMIGYSRTEEGVARLLSRLRTIPDVGVVQLGSASLTELSTEDVYEFSVALTLRGPDGRVPVLDPGVASPVAAAPAPAPAPPPAPAPAPPPAPAESTSPAAEPPAPAPTEEATQ
jgi:Tfp pilus assembly protein PilN